MVNKTQNLIISNNFEHLRNPETPSNQEAVITQVATGSIKNMNQSLVHYDNSLKNLFLPSRSYPFAYAKIALLAMTTLTAGIEHAFILAFSWFIPSAFLSWEECKENYKEQLIMEFQKLAEDLPSKNLSEIQEIANQIPNVQERMLTGGSISKEQATEILKPLKEALAKLLPQEASLPAETSSLEETA